MKIHDGTIEQITPDDIDTDGVLHIPRGTQSISPDVIFDIAVSNINKISYYSANRVLNAPIISFEDNVFVVIRRISFKDTILYRLATPQFCAYGLCGEQYYGLMHNNEFDFADDLNKLIKNARIKAWTTQTERAAHKMNVDDDAIDIIINAAKQTINQQNLFRISMKTRRYINREIAHAAKYLSGIKTFCEKYKNNDSLEELTYTNLWELGNIIFPIKSQDVGKTCTRLVKRRPIDNDHIHAMMVAGYKNPGCFPYQWLANTPAAGRGAITEALHAEFGRAARDLYSPAATPIGQHSVLTRTVDALARRITEITGVDTRIQYLDQGFFSKTYKITCDNQTYLLKVYHSDNEYSVTKNTAHDIEAQNSFLVSGKKYCGRIRYRTILTAGMGHQRGMRYILYPFVTGEFHDIKHNPYDVFKTYNFRDNIGQRNLCGDTIIDTGMICVNECRIGRPYMTKIINTILYRPWQDLAIVLNKYNTKQISESIDFISQRLDTEIPNYDLINAKIKYLARNRRIR